MNNVVLECMAGLGDNVYNRVVARLFLQSNYDVYVQTCWPQVYVDLPVRCLPFPTELRTQRRNVARGWDWATRPVPTQRYHPRYVWSDNMSAPRSMAKSVGFVSPVVSFAFTPPWKAEKGDKPLALVVPPTVRREWPNVARPCDPAYMQQLIDTHRGFDWVEVSDLSPGEERYFGQPLAGVRHAGSLTTEQLIGLFASADIIVTGVGYALPLGLALRRPTLCLFGGDIPERLLVEDWMIAAPYRALSPDPFCACGIKGRHHEPICNRKLDPLEVERAFREVAFRWDRDQGYWPVNINGQYDRSYYENYCRLEKTPMGQELNAFRVSWVNQYFPDMQLIDVGVGSCQFVRATNALGADINPASVEALKALGRHVDLSLLARTEVLTFWDALEHVPQPEALLSKAAHGVAVSIPIFESREQALRSKHFKPNEHLHYWTHEGFKRYMRDQGFTYLNHSDRETQLGREGILTYAFRRMG